MIMAQTSKIEWTDATWNPVRGCTKVSPGCAHCYAETFAERWRGIPGHPYEQGFDLRLVPEKLDEPLHWRKPRRVFVNSMSDLFHEDVPFEFIDRVFAVMALCPHHVFQVLTKRPEIAAKYDDYFNVTRLSCAIQQFKPRVRHDDPWGTPWLADVVEPFREHGYLPNVWPGCSVENQKYADERREPMRRLAEAGWLAWVSYEPALGPVDWTGWEFLRWMVSGGESGPGARPSHPDWHRQTRDFCQAHGIAYFFKQWGAWAPFATTAHYDDQVIGGYCGGPSVLSIYKHKDGVTTCLAEWPDGTKQRCVEIRPVGHEWGRENRCSQTYVGAGKKQAGRQLDGREWNEFPQTREEEPVVW
jgi:protein gp37